MRVRAGIGYDAHRLVAGRPLVIGGVEVPGAERGLAGHSDADVLTHAVIDALLGAAGMGDIGERYPDTDERWQDADSIVLLRDVCGSLTIHGLSISHVDAAVICEAPKLAPWRDAMRARLAETMDLTPPEVSVKFKTNEGLGALGRNEGIAAMAVATLQQAA